MTKQPAIPGPAPFSEIRPLGRSSRLARQLRKLAGDPGAQREEGIAFVEGVNLVREMMTAGIAPGRILLSPRLFRTEEGRQLAGEILQEQAGPALARIDDALLGRLSRVESHQGVMAIVERPAWSWKELTGGGGRILVACGVQDPGNAGALARITEAAWGGGIVYAGTAADPWSARALRASAGSLFRLPHLRSADVADALSRLRDNGYTLIGADPSAQDSFRDSTPAEREAFVCGSEGRGLPEPVRASMDRLVRIPIHPAVESLNVAVAAALLLFDRAPGGKP